MCKLNREDPYQITPARRSGPSVFRLKAIVEWVKRSVYDFDIFLICSQKIGFDISCKMSRPDL